VLPEMVVKEFSMLRKKLGWAFPTNYLQEIHAYESLQEFNQNILISHNRVP
jgi:hypothetical protein